MIRPVASSRTHSHSSGSSIGVGVGVGVKASTLDGRDVRETARPSFSLGQAVKSRAREQSAVARSRYFMGGDYTLMRISAQASILPLMPCGCYKRGE